MRIIYKIEKSEVSEENLQKFLNFFSVPDENLTIMFTDVEVRLDDESIFVPRLIVKYKSTFVANLAVFSGNDWGQLAIHVINCLDNVIANE